MGTSPLYIVDGSGYIYRAFYAIAPLTSASGLPTNALLGFTRMMLKLLNETGAEHLVVAFDTGKPTFRHEKYSEYKANRKECPPELVQQMPYFRKIVDALGIKFLEKEGFEADDIIGTLVHTFSKQKQEIIIVSGDKDLTQLVSDKVEVWDAMREIHYNREQVKEKFGVFPEQIVDLLALTGDASDNIPGVKGIGGKTALQLLQEFGSADAMIEQIDRLETIKTIRGAKSLKTKILEDAQNLKLSRELVSLDCQVEPFAQIDNVSEFEWQSFNLEQMIPLFEELGFQSVLKKLNEPTEPKGATKKDAAVAADMSARIPADADYTMLTEDELPAFAEKLAGVEAFAFDTETTGLDVLSLQLAGISISWENKKAFFIPTYSEVEPDKVISLDTVKKYLGEIFVNPKIKKVGWNLKYDIGVLEERGIKVTGPFIDGMIIWSYLHPEGGTSKGLKNITKLVLGEEMATFEEVLGGQEHVGYVTLDNVAKYACYDADATWRIVKKLYVQLKAGRETSASLPNRLESVFNDVEMPLVRILSLMERTGVKVDVHALEALKKEFAAELKKFSKEIYQLAGREFNINSPKQLSEVLFDELKIPDKGLRKNTQAVSTNAYVLSELAQEYEIARILLKYREVFKLQTTYVEALLKLNNPESNRVHSSFNQAHTATGRLSSSDPNLQNIPIRNERGAQLRKIFVGESGFKIIKADYSQIELRVLAHLSEDVSLINSFLRGEDIHLATAIDIFGDEALDTTRQKELRRYAKSINFGIVYGMGAMRLAQSLDISRSQAQQYIDNYFSKYSKVREYFDGLEKLIAEHGYVETMFGRRRYAKDLSEIASYAGRRDGGYIKRALLNTTIQGSAAEIIKIAMAHVMDKFESAGLFAKPVVAVPPIGQAEQLHNYLPDNRGLARLILQVHDELVFEVHESVVSDVKQMIINSMEHAVKLKVPLKIGIEIGTSWA